MNDPVDFHEVYQQELRAIRTRRRFHERAGGAAVPSGDGPDGQRQEPSESSEPSCSTNDNSPAKDLVGLALSGGGVRSAGFNLGLVQALDEKGLFSQVDYLSTVSGGGFIGGYLSSLSLDARDDAPDCDADQTGHGGESSSDEDSDAAARPPASHERPMTPLAASERAPQPRRVRELIYHGDYLRFPLKFLNRHLIGVVALNVFFLSGLIALAAGSAWVFRSLDGTTSRYVLHVLGFQDDLLRALFPSFLLGGLWIGSWAFCFWQRGGRAKAVVPRVFLALLIASLLIALTVVLGTGSLSIQTVADVFQIKLSPGMTDQLKNWLKIVVITPIVVSLIPFLNPVRLIRSGMRSSPVWWERILFKTAGAALLLGVPLLVFGFFAREDISGWNKERDGQLAKTDVSWKDFWREVGWNVQSTSFLDRLLDEQSHVSKKIWSAQRPLDPDELKAIDPKVKPEPLSPELLTVVERYFSEDPDFRDNKKLPSNKAMLGQIEELDNQYEANDQGVGFVQRWFYLGETAMDWLAGGRNLDNELFLEQLRRKRDGHYLRQAVMANVNILLIDPEFHKAFDEDLKPGALSSERTKELEPKLTPLITEAKAIKSNKGDPSRIHDTTEVNRQLLSAYYGDKIVWPKEARVRLAVVIDQDQQYRKNAFWTALGIFVVAGLIVNLNWTSLHGYYRSQVAKTWVAECDGFRRHVPLARLDTTAHGYPYHLMSATAHYLRQEGSHQASTGHFLFSRLFCGTTRTGYASTEDYCGGSYDLASAMALSGAAVSPLNMKNLFAAMMLFLLNFRLGQWLPNPGHKPWRPRWLFGALSRWPVPFFVLAGLFRASENRAFCFVTDGGHFENLGVGPLLRRNCKLIICADVGYDPKYEFTDFLALQRRQRMDNGIELTSVHSGVVRFDDLVPNDDKLSDAHYVVAKIEYPERDDEGNRIQRTGPDDGYLIYIKPTFTGQEDIDLSTHRRTSSGGDNADDFPHDSTADQFYPPERFESYRRLGEHIGFQLCESLRGAPLSDWQPRIPPKPPGPPQQQETAQQEGETRTDETPAPSQDPVSRVIERLEEEDVSIRKLAAMSLCEMLLDETLSRDERRHIITPLVDRFSQRSEDLILRLTVSQMLKVCAPKSPPVRSAAIKVSLDADENTEMRVAAIDVLVATGLTTQAARNAIKQLKRDSNREVAAAVEDLPTTRAGKKKPDRAR